MIKQSFAELIATKAQFIDLLDRLGVNYGNSNRWAESFRLVEELELARTTDKIDDIDPTTMGNMRFALLDLSELSDILSNISENDDENILKRKFKLLLEGVADRTKESESNTTARDTQLELVLNAYFRKAKLNSVISDPHPDLVLDQGNLKYGVECKRIYTPNRNSVVRAVRNAATQLRRNYLDDEKLGIVAIGIDRHLTGGDKILESGSELAARVFLSHEIDQFIKAYVHRWSQTHIIGDERIAGVLVYMSLMGIAEQENIPIHATQMGVTHCYWTRFGRQNFGSVKHDIAEPLLAAAGEINEYVRKMSEAAETSQ